MSHQNGFFVAGGPLKTNNPSYVERPADEELYQRILAREFSYVLTPRQMGKSSLMYRTANRLKDEGFRSVEIELNQLGSSLTEDKWYLGLLAVISRRLRLTTAPEVWWAEHDWLGPVHRFVQFMREVVLVEINDPVVIFIDEIDITIRLDFSDDFFAAIRSLYTTRNEDPIFERLIFVLLGAVSPADLIKDNTRTPFNIGGKVVLEDFDYADAQVLLRGFQDKFSDQSEVIFKRIYHWTGGQPYLTQRLCKGINEAKQPDWTASEIDHLVQTVFLSEQGQDDTNIKFVQEKLLRHPHQQQLLKLYKKIYDGREVLNDPRSELHNQLLLLGIVKDCGGQLVCRNEIYKAIFNKSWLTDNIQTNWRVVTAYTMAIIGLLAIVITSGYTLYNFWYIPYRKEKIELRFYKAASESDAAEIQVGLLADLFELQGLFGTPDYDAEARDLFFNLPPPQQAALLTTPNERLPVVIEGIYTTLASLDSANNPRSLDLILSGIESLPPDDRLNRLNDELRSWVQGRTAVANGQFDEALRAYTDAWEINPNNPAILFERAKVYAELRQYNEALADLDRLTGLVTPLEVSQSAPTPPPPTLTPTPEDTPFPLMTEPMAAADEAGSGLPDEASTPDPTNTPTATLTPTLSPTPTPEFVKIGSEFETTNQVIAVVRDLINSDPNLVGFLEEAKTTRYTNLREFGLVPAPALTPFAQPVCDPKSNYEENDSISLKQACRLEFDRPYRAFPEDEEDYYYFIIDEPTTLSLQISDYAASTGGQFVIYDALDFSKWVQIKPVDDTQVMSEEDLAPGKYYVRVYTPPEGVDQDTTSYQLLLSSSLLPTPTPRAVADNLAPPTSTATATSTPTPTPTSTPTPTLTPTPRPTLAPNDPTSTATPTSTPTFTPTPTPTPGFQFRFGPKLLEPIRFASYPPEETIRFTWESLPLQGEHQYYSVILVRDDLSDAEACFHWQVKEPETFIKPADHGCTPGDYHWGVGIATDLSAGEGDFIWRDDSQFDERFPIGIGVPHSGGKPGSGDSSGGESNGSNGNGGSVPDTLPPPN